MADHVVAIQRGKKVGWFSSHGPPSNTPPFTGSDIDAELFEPVHPGPIADTTLYTADNIVWPTADGGILEGATDAFDANILAVGALAEAVDATDILDAEVISGTAAIWVEIVEPVSSVATADTTNYSADNTIWPTADGGVLDGAQDYFDAEVISAEVPVTGGGVEPPPRRPFPVVGIGYGILPALEGEGHGVVTVAGAGIGKLPRLGGSAEGSVGVAGRSAAQLVLLRAAAAGDCGQSARAEAVFKALVASSRGTVIVRGSGSGVILKFKAAATGQHDDDEAAVMAFLLAA